MRILSYLACALVLSAAACSDPSGPGDGQTRTIHVNLCSGLAPGFWFAYKNEGGAWVQVTPNSSGEIVFDATEKVSVASAISFFGLTFTQVINATATELEGTTSAACEADFGEKSMSGTVAGLTGEQVARISAGSVDALASASDPSWLLEDLANHPVDLIATRYASFSTQPAQRVLVRRGVTPTNGSIATLDFGGPESAALENAIATFTGIPANGSFTMVNSVQTANGTSHQLGDLSTGPTESTTQAVNYVSLPASLRIATDLHVISASASNATATQSILNYYRAPSAKTLAFGPILGEPTISNAATSPVVRPHFQLPAQTPYTSAMVVELGESVGEESRYVSILSTAAFLVDEPAIWDITVPDMSSAGYDAAWGLQTTDYSWAVSGFGASGDNVIIGVPPTDGTTIVSSTRGKIEVIELGPARRRMRGLPTWGFAPATLQSRK